MLVLEPLVFKVVNGHTLIPLAQHGNWVSLKPSYFFPAFEKQVIQQARKVSRILGNTFELLHKKTCSKKNVTFFGKVQSKEIMLQMLFDRNAANLLKLKRL